MRAIGLRGVVRGKETPTTQPDKGAPCPADRVNRQFHARQPNLLWLSDFTYAATWQGFVYVAFVIDAYADCSDPSGTSLPLRPRRGTMPSRTKLRWLRDSNQHASGKPGAVHA